MLAHDVDYLPEAIAAVRVEIERRNLDPVLVAELRSDSEASRVREVQAAEKSLSWLAKIALFVFSLFFPIILIPAGLLGTVYRQKGYVRKSKECWTWMWYGVGFWFLWFLLLSITLRYLLPGVETLGGIVVIAVSGAVSISVILLIDWYRRRVGTAPHAR